MSHPSQGAITCLLAKLPESRAQTALMPLIYQDLRRIAAAQFRQDRRNHTLQPTELVHEAYLRLIKAPKGHWESRAHFFGSAARVMRQVLVDYARRKKTTKRGGKDHRIELREDLVFSWEDPSGFLALDDALKRLKKLAPRQARIIELRFFAGLSIKETTQVLGVGATTVKAASAAAEAWLRRELEGGA